MEAESLGNPDDPDSYSETVVKQEPSSVDELSRSGNEDLLQEPPQQNDLGSVFGCEICEATFPTKSKLGMHQRRHRPHAFFCSVCDKTFIEKYELNRHLQKVHKMAPLQHVPQKSKHFEVAVIKTPQWFCKECDKTFSLRSQYTRHLRRHRPQNFVCDVCSKTFAENSDLQRHVKAIHGKSPILWYCEKCDKPFKTRKQHTLHLRRHRPKTFKCGICSKGFPENRDLKRHEQKSHKQKAKSWLCQECNKTFESQGKHTRHMRLHAPKTFTCSVCSKGFSEHWNLLRHERTAHYDSSQSEEETEQEAEARCDIVVEQEPITNYEVESETAGNACPSVVVKKELIIDESVEKVDASSVEKEVQSDYSGIVVKEEPTSNNDVESQMIEQEEADQFPTIVKEELIIEDVLDLPEVEGLQVVKRKKRHKPTFVCVLCNQSFGSRYTLEKHKAIIHGIHLSHHIFHPDETGLYRCEECGKSFPYRFSFATHIARHKYLREHTFPCKLCGTEFTSKRILMLHGAKFHATSPSGTDSSVGNVKVNEGGLFQCDDCSKTFNSARSYSAHQIVHKRMRERNFVCVPCDEAFSTKFKYERHQTLFHTHRLKYKPRKKSSKKQN